MKKTNKAKYEKKLEILRKTLSCDEPDRVPIFELYVASNHYCLIPGIFYLK